MIEGPVRVDMKVVWQVSLVTAELAAAATPLRAGHAPLVSPGAVELPQAELGFSAGLMARDPDGHALLLIEPLR